MADTPDFRDLLNKPMSEFPDMPNLPGGKFFYGKLVSVEADHSRVKATPLFRFHVRLTDPGADVTPEMLKPITDGGFSLADYQVTAEFYLTPNAMRMFRRFIESIGFDPNKTFAESLKLDPETGNPTADTIEAIRGIDVMCKTPPADDQGRVFNRLDQITGAKR